MLKLRTEDLLFSLKPNHGKIIPACGNPECGISTGICGNTTCGTGKLDQHGYWEFPCYICEEKWDRWTYEDWEDDQYHKNIELDKAAAVMTNRQAVLEGYA